ncbi:MAG: YqhA family protein [Deltaproteobacteria bacterium]|nr:YqhA family protein [Deltaproteobacteria bacterium]
MEKMFESMLWNSRYLVLLAVIASLLTSVLLFFMAFFNVGYLLMNSVAYIGDFLSGEITKEMKYAFHADMVGQIISSIDDFLLGTVLLIFSLGLYELFISKIDQAEEGNQILLIRNLDDLKNRLAKVILMILIVTFFKNVIQINYHEPLNILYLAAGILMVALALYFSHKQEH